MDSPNINVPSYFNVISDLESLKFDISTGIPAVPGKNRLIRACDKEIHSLCSLAEDAREHAASCSNLAHMRAVFNVARYYEKRLLGLLCKYQNAGAHTEITQSIIGPFSAKKKSSVIVDIVCLQTPNEDEYLLSSGSVVGNASDAHEWQPHLWIKVVTRNARRINAAWLGEATQGGTCLYDQLKELNSTIIWRQRKHFPGWIQLIVHWLPTTDDKLTDLDPQLMHRIKSTLGIPFLTSAQPWSPQSTSVLSENLVKSCRSLKDYMLPIGYLQHTISRLSPNMGQSERAFRRDLSATLIDSVDHAFSGRHNDCSTHPMNSPVCRKNSLDQLLENCHSAPLPQSVMDGLDILPRINLDVSALIAMVSDLSQFIPDHLFNSNSGVCDHFHILSCPERRSALLEMSPRFKSKTVDWMIEAEATRPVLLVLKRILQGSVLLVCRTALVSFLNILTTVAGPREWERGINLLTRLIVVPDLCYNIKDTADLTKLNNRQKSQLILDVGNAFQAPTVTSNSHLLRCQRDSSYNPMAFLVPARALTEAAPRKDD